MSFVIIEDIKTYPSNNIWNFTVYAIVLISLRIFKIPKRSLRGSFIDALLGMKTA